MTQLPTKYLPQSLSKTDKAKQKKSIKLGVDRPKVDYSSRRSKWTVKAEKHFGKTPTLTQLSKASKVPMSSKVLKEIINRGEGAYYSSGSRPNVSATQWAMGVSQHEKRIMIWLRNTKFLY